MLEIARLISTTPCVKERAFTADLRKKGLAIVRVFDKARKIIDL
jgi:hypothetical protein